MNNNSGKSKKIAQNTVILYIRSFAVLLITLYTSRVILSTLGISDYGLYNVVGGVVSLFAFLRTSLTKSTQRFLNFEMARGGSGLRDTFCVSMTIHVVIALLALLLGETIGLWFLNTYIQIPNGRELSANIVYQTTVVSLVFTILTVPYQANIIAREEMGYFAIVSIIDAILKLGICYIILIGDSDRLIKYGVLIMIIHVINFLMYALYCRMRYFEARFMIKFDKELIKEMLGYTTWTIVAQIAIVGTNQGNNILVNMFHSVTANAGMGVAHQVNSAVVSLTSNFQTAFNPQITKSYATKDYDYLRFLINSTSKISFFLLLLVCLPLAFNINYVLELWLKEVPPYSGIFCILVLINSILNALSAPLNFCVLSSGNIKWFQIVTSLVYFSDLVLVYILFSFGYPAPAALVIKVLIMVLILFIRLFFAKREIPCLSYLSYFREVLIPLFLVSVVSIILGHALFSLTKILYIRLLLSFVLVIISAILIYYCGLNRNERKQLKKIISKRRK